MGINSNGTTLIDNGLFQNIGSVTWDTTAKTSGFTGVSGNGYFVNTTSGAITVTLPSSPSAGDVIGIKDYANTADTNNITIGRNGSNINGDASNYIMNVEGLSVILVYVDGTKGWLLTNASKASDITAPKFTIATGGTITTSGNCKIHTFTSPGTFCVSQIGDGGAGGPSNVDFLVVAGGGGGGGKGQEDVGGGGGGGAGGFRTSFPSPAGTTPVSVQGYPITVGGGGAGGPNAPGPSGSPTRQGSAGSNSVFSTTTSAGGGQGGGSGGVPASAAGGNGGSGGGGGPAAGTGNTPPVSPPQGNNGGTRNNNRGGGGGGAGGAGTNGSTPQAGPGGAGTANSITGSPVTRAGGGGGGLYTTPGSPPAAGGAGGSGGGGAGAIDANATSGTANTGGGGGGVGGPNTGTARSGGAGGSGIVIIRYKFQ